MIKADRLSQRVCSLSDADCPVLEVFPTLAATTGNASERKECFHHQLRSRGRICPVSCKIDFVRAISVGGRRLALRRWRTPVICGPQTIARSI